MDTPPVDNDLLDFAVGLAERAGRLAAERFFADGHHTSVKPDGTAITASDLTVEELIRNELARHVPRRRGLRGGSGRHPRHLRPPLGDRPHRRR